GAGVFHVSRTPAGFGRKVRLYKGESNCLDLAVDPDGGRLLVVFSTEKGVFVASRPEKGSWTRPTLLHAERTGNPGVAVEPLGKGRFVIRTHRGETKAWRLTPR